MVSPSATAGVGQSPLLSVQLPPTQEEVWQRFAGKWATGDAGQKPCATAAQPLLILQGFLIHSLQWLKTSVFGQDAIVPTGNSNSIGKTTFYQTGPFSGESLPYTYLEEGLPQTQVLLWVAGAQLRAMFEGVVLAEYHCRYDWRDYHVTDIGAGMFYPTRFASPQGRLIPLTPSDSLVVYRASAPKRRGARVSSTPQLLLFEVVPTG